MIENTDGMNMIFENEKLHTKYDMATTLVDLDERYSIRDVCNKICALQEEITKINKDKKEIRLSEEYADVKLDLKRIVNLSYEQDADNISRKIKRDTNASSGLEKKIFEIFGLTIKDIDKKKEELQWSETDIKEFKKQYLKILYLFYIMENIIFPSKKVVDIFRHPDMDFLDKENTDCGIFLRIIKGEVKKECEQSYIDEIDGALSTILGDFGTYAKRMVEKDFDEEGLRILQSKCEAMDRLFSQQEEINAIYEKQLLHWFYLQLCLYEERCYVKGYIRAYEHKIKERSVKDEYKLSDKIYQTKIWKEDISQPYNRYHLYLDIASYCFQKPFDEITDKEFEMLNKIESKLATYINIVNKQENGIYDKRPFTLGECVAMIQEILCIDSDDKINYDYFGHHNSSSISLKRSLEKGHGKSLYTISELVLCRKFLRGRILIHKDYDENIVMVVDTIGKLESMILWDVFKEKTINDIVDKIKVYKEFLEKYV